MNCHVVIPAVAWSALLERSLAALVDSGHPLEQITVVLDGASDLPDDVSRFPGIGTVLLATNRGYAAACNAGFLACSSPLAASDAVLFLNDDAVVPAGWQASLAVLANDTVGAVGFTIDGPAGPRKRWPGVERRGGRVLAGPTLAGSCFALRVSTYRRFGGMDESFVMYGEETDLFQRLQRHGLQLVETPPIVWHEGEATMGSRSFRRAWYSLRNPLRCAMLNDGLAGIMRKLAGTVVQPAAPRRVRLGANPTAARRRGYGWPARVALSWVAVAAVLAEAPILLRRRWAARSDVPRAGSRVVRDSAAMRSAPSRAER